MRFLLALLLPLVYLSAAPAPIPVKVVIVTMFERGEDTGDAPGEFQFWVEREHLDRIIEFPEGNRHIRANADGSVIAICTSPGVTNATSTVMALGHDPRFDLRKAYWLVAGIAGVDPEDASLASAAWATYVVDTDLVYEIDAREAPQSWQYSRLPIGSKEPNRMSPFRRDNVLHELNGKLADWAYRISKDTPLPDTPVMQKYRAQYTGMPNALKPPFVLKGDTAGGSTFWHGRTLTKWANDWMKLWSEGKGNFVMTEMEDNGTAVALKRLTAAGKADYQRLMVLRTASNYCMPAPGQTAEDSLTRPYDGLIPALESAHRVGSRVLHALVDGWKQFENKIPE